jgi:GH25 family lysozyme M1 (1,4-beta-N-acetylmuramidase)
MLNGIDISNVNGPVDWESWRGKIAFAGVKISEGTTFADPLARANVVAAHALGIPVMGYHFLHNGTGSKGGAPQAEWFLANAKKAGLRPGLDLIAVDVEDGGLDIDPATVTGQDVEQAYLHFDLVAAGFCNQVREHHFPGYHPVLYTEISMAPALVNCGGSPLWLANPSRVHTGQLGPWASPSFEQTGQRGIDVDVFYGDAAALAKLAIPHG